MFKILLENNYADTLRDNAKKHIKDERMQYKDVIYFILKFASDNKLLISNVDLLLGKQEYWDFVNIFALNVDENTKSLISQLCKTFKRLFFMKIVSEGHEYYIEYNLRRICTLNSIKPYKSYSLYDFISPVKQNVGDFIIYMFPYMLEIIYLYGNLYNPALASEWKNIYSDIKKMETYVDEDIARLLSQPKPKDQAYISSSGGNEKKCPTNRCNQEHSQIIEIKKMVIEFIKEGHYIMCDEFYNLENPAGVIEVISPNAEVDFKLLVNYISKFISYGITYKEKSIYLPKDSQMKKYNFYVEIPFVKNMKKKHFLTIYNNTSYELVNYYEKNQYKYADPITQLKFAYLSIWSGNIVQKTHRIHFDEFISFLKEKKTNIDHLRKKVDIYELKKKYTGMYLPESISKKMTLTFTNNKSNFYCHDFQSSSEELLS